MKESNDPQVDLYRVCGEGMLFNDRVYTRGDVVTGAVVGRHLLSLIENGHLKPIAPKEDTFRERLTDSVAKLIGLPIRAR